MHSLTMRSCLVVLMATTPAAIAQETRYLLPSEFSIDAGGAVSLEVRGDAPVAQAWPDADMSHFFVLSPGAKSNRPRLPHPAAGKPSWKLDRQGVSMIGFDLNERTIEAAPPTLAAFLDAHAPAAITERPQGAAPLEIARVETFSTLIRVGDVPGASSVAVDKTTQAAEIRPLFDPTAVEPGTLLPVKTYVHADGEKGARVFATHLDSGRRLESITNKSAIAKFTLPWAGRWLLEFHHVEPPQDGRPWTIVSATMTFEITEEVDR